MFYQSAEGWSVGKVFFFFFSGWRLNSKCEKDMPS